MTKMGQSQLEKLKAKVRAKWDPAKRYVPMWAQLRVWRRGPNGKAAPAELLKRQYGGLFDRRRGQYIPGATPAPGEVHEIPVHPGQLPVVLHPGGKMRVMVFGGPGSGKTRAVAIWLVLQALQFPGSSPKKLRVFGHVGATAERKLRMWEAHHEIVPASWIDYASENDGEVLWASHVMHDFRAAKEPSAAIGTPIQGVSWWKAGVDETQNVGDRAQRDIDERGRNAGVGYQVMETATNVDYLPAFIARRESYKHSPRKEVIRLNPMDNPWVELAYWERFRSEYSEREFRQRILSEDVPPERLVYAAFSYSENVRHRPAEDDKNYKDITSDLLEDKWDLPRPFLVGQDFGVLTNASEILKAYKHLPTGETHWWVVDELTSGSYIGTEGHARMLVKHLEGAEKFVVSADPHVNTKDTDRSDFHMFERHAIEVKRAGPPPIRVKHRVSMLNALFCDANGRRRLFVDATEDGRPRAPRLVESLLSMELDDLGRAESVRKDKKDPTHWPAALAYGVFPWEKLRGFLSVVSGEDEPEPPPLTPLERIKQRIKHRTERQL